MNSFKIKNKSIGLPTDQVFIIAEIGQNHQGSIETAKEMILAAKACGCDCVKFQKSNLPAKFTKSALNRPYINSNSWGFTYGEHKEFLEFSIDQFCELKIFAEQQDLIFSASAMDEVSLDELIALNLPFIKIGSGDANNFSLLEKAAKSKIPLIISTGMQIMSTIERIVKIMEKNCKENFALLHCVSAYPTKPENANLKMIKMLKNKFPNIVIGYSGHEEGILISQAAVLSGAKIIERHFTLNKNQKGSDHKCSLLPGELKTLISTIRKFNINGNMNNEEILQLENILNENEDDVKVALKDVNDKQILDCEMECHKKLGKSLVYSKNLEMYHIIEKFDVVVKVSEPFGISAERIDDFVGKKLRLKVFEDEIIEENDFL